MADVKIPKYSYRYLDSPVGNLLLTGIDDLVRVISFASGKTAIAPMENWQMDEACFGECAQQLNEYFRRERRVFDFPMQAQGTDFQHQVWKALCDIPYGGTCSYGDIAARIGRPKAVRAVGAANGANPLPIVVPCHRVIGANSALTGFGGGLEIKRFLLNLEGAGNLQGELF